MNSRVTFTRPAAERIGRVVRIVESGDRSVTPWTVPTANDNPAPQFKICTFTGGWNVDTFKTVTVLGSTATLVAINVFGAINASCGGSPVGIARDGTAWYAIAARCQ